MPFLNESFELPKGARYAFPNIQKSKITIWSDIVLSVLIIFHTRYSVEIWKGGTKFFQNVALMIFYTNLHPCKTLYLFICYGKCGHRPSLRSNITITMHKNQAGLTAHFILPQIAGIKAGAILSGIGLLRYVWDYVPVQFY